MSYVTWGTVLKKKKTKKTQSPFSSVLKQGWQYLKDGIAAKSVSQVTVRAQWLATYLFWLSLISLLLIYFYYYCNECYFKYLG